MKLMIDQSARLDEHTDMSAAELQVTARVAKQLPGDWEAGLEKDEQGQMHIVLFASEQSAPAFSLCREGRFVKLMICRGNDASLQGAFGSAQQALLAVADAVLSWSLSSL
jgi:hypothetical protein